MIILKIKITHLNNNNLLIIIITLLNSSQNTKSLQNPYNNNNNNNFFFKKKINFIENFLLQRKYEDGHLIYIYNYRFKIA